MMPTPSMLRTATPRHVMTYYSCLTIPIINIFYMTCNPYYLIDNICYQHAHAISLHSNIYMYNAYIAYKCLYIFIVF